MPAKGRREQTKGGDEADAASRRARRIVTFRPGKLRKIKRRMNKRASACQSRDAFGVVTCIKRGALIVSAGRPPGVCVEIVR